jgi:hypothetical protein
MAPTEPRTPLVEYFRKDRASARLRDVTLRAVRRAGRSTIRSSRSQIAFSRRRTFAWIWAPRQYLGARAAPLALSIALSRRIRSSRWKEVVEPRPGRYMHHLEVWRAADLDATVQRWLAEAWPDAVSLTGVAPDAGAVVRTEALATLVSTAVLFDPAQLKPIR